MNIENIISIGVFLCSVILFSPVLGSYLARVYTGENNFLTRFFGPVEKFIYRISLINPKEDMHWKTYARAVLWLSLVGIFFVFAILTFQNLLPLNPQNFAGMSWSLAFNTAVSFVTNTNWQAYAGETTLSYFSQTIGLTVQNFISAAVGMAVLVALIRGITRKNSDGIGNFWVDLVRTILYVLLPFSFVLSLFLVIQGVVENFSSYVSARTLEGAEQMVPMGPAASQIAIKQIGSNGGGFFSANSAHPFENPTPLTNFLQLLAILLLPSSLVFMFGVMINDRKHALMIYAVILSLFLAFLGLSLQAEFSKNPSLHISQSLEGKDLRHGISSSVLWSTVTTITSNGSTNASHDSLSPAAGGLALLSILLGEIIFGGVGSGLYGMLLFVVLTVFLAGLMVGRTPEYLGKKLDVKDIQLVVFAILLPSAIVLIGAGISSVLPVPLKSISNNGPHGLTQILYAWGSAANNNGSAFGGLMANNNFYHLFLSIAMLLGRFGVIFSVLAIAGNLANKKIIPESSSTLATDTPTFAVLLGFIIVIIGALTYFPALSLGPLIEHFLMVTGRTF